MEKEALTRMSCPKCKQEAIIDTWKPPDGYDPHMRKFICSDCGLEFYVTIASREKRQAYDRQLSR